MANLNKLSKAAKKPKVERDPVFQKMLEKRAPTMSSAISKWFKADAKRISALLVAALFPAKKADLSVLKKSLHKALTQAQIDAIVDNIDLDNMRLLAGLITEGTVDVFKDAYANGAAVGGMAVDMNLVSDSTMEYSKARSAELVGMTVIDGKVVPNPNPAWSISETTRTMLRAEVTKAIAAGSSAQEMAKAIESNYAFSDTRALNIARTELSNAFNQGSIDGWKESGVKVYKRSLLSDSYDVEDECGVAARDGAIPLDKAFSNGKMSPAYHPNCLIAGTVVSAELITAHYRRWFEGEVVTITTASGKQLTATPNHPVLTRAGWVSVGELKLGDCVFESVHPKRLIVSENPDNNNMPTVIEQIPDALVMRGGVTARQVPTSAIDFHGDGVVDGNVDIVFSARLLERATPIVNNACDLGFKMASATRGNLIADSSLNKVGISVLSSTNGGVSGGRSEQSLFSREPAGGDGAGLTPRSDGNAAVNQSSHDSASGDSVSLRERQDGFFIDVKAAEFAQVNLSDSALSVKNSSILESSHDNLLIDTESIANHLGRFSAQVVGANIVDIRHDNFSGHVYNLQTVSGWYVANGIVTHNCKCSLSPVLQKEKAKATAKADIGLLMKGEGAGHPFRGNQHTGGKQIAAKRKPPHQLAHNGNLDSNAATASDIFDALTGEGK